MVDIRAAQVGICSLATVGGCGGGWVVSKHVESVWSGQCDGSAYLEREDGLYSCGSSYLVGQKFG
jgi:hypothetical protein